MNKEEEAAVAEKEGEFELPNKQVRVTPIKKRRRGLPADHENNFLFGESYLDLSLPIRRDRNAYVNPLTSEEKKFFEDPSRSGLSFERGDLDPNRKEGNFWKGFSVKLTKFPKILDLSDPMDYLEYKVLLQNTHIIAPSGEKKWDNPEYKFALEDLDFEEKTRARTAETKAEAYMEFGKIKDSTEKLKQFLRVYGKRPAENHKLESLKSDVYDIVENQPEKFLDIMEDSHYNTKLLIQEALEAGALEKRGTRYSRPGGDEIGRTLGETIEFLENKKNSDIFMEIRSEVKRHKGEADEDETESKSKSTSSTSNKKSNSDKNSGSKSS